MTVTVFTPTYNRAHLLKRLHESLCQQTDNDFEWIIVDDGSTDDTEKVIAGFCTENRIAIRYFKKENGGKHTAINLGVQKANGELFWILDSDDSLPSNAIETVISYCDVLSDKNIGGICGYMAHHNGKVIGYPIVTQPIAASSIDMRYKMGITGDMMEIFKTNVLRQYPFPEIIDERFYPEILVWNRIAKKYKLYLIPDVIYYRDYLDGGLTDNIIKIRMKSPIATMMTYSEMFVLNIPLKKKIKAAINYWRFAYCTKKRSVKIASWGNLFAPIGWLMHLRDKSIVKG